MVDKNGTGMYRNEPEWRRNETEWTRMVPEYTGTSRNDTGIYWNGALLNHETAKHRNSETPKQRNTETAIFFQIFFLEHRNSQRNKFSWYWFCWEICGICNDGLQTWMSRCAIDSLDNQSGWKLSLSLAEKYIQTKVSYSHCCILSEKRRNLTQIKIQTFADAKSFEFVKNPSG